MSDAVQVVTEAVPVVTPLTAFDEASAAVVAYLKKAVPMGYWSVSRFDGDRQLYLTVADDAYGKQMGDSHAWSDSMCRVMTAGEAPHVAPDAMAIPAYAATGVAAELPIGAYVGMPITKADGSLFGTLCALDPAVQEETLRRHEPLLRLLGGLLAAVLAADVARSDSAMEALRARDEADGDPLTGLFNRRGWNRQLTASNDRHRRFGDPGSVIIADLDGLKVVNDTSGHSAGDELIALAAAVLSANCRGRDVLARLGGDEFGILAATTPDWVAQLVARLRAALAAAGVQASFGHAQVTMAEGYLGAWAAADRAMYADKAQRRGVAQTASVPHLG